MKYWGTGTFDQTLAKAALRETRFLSGNCLSDNMSLFFQPPSWLRAQLRVKLVTLFKLAHGKSVSCLAATFPYLFWAPPPNQKKSDYLLTRKLCGLRSSWSSWQKIRRWRTSWCSRSPCQSWRQCSEPSISTTRSLPLKIFITIKLINAKPLKIKVLWEYLWW
jgi:hypothetical protein